MTLTSIVIPTYNAWQLLADCIYSIRQHTDTPYEIIVIDNGSSDRTIDLCRREQITFVSLPYNRGFPQACNIGLKLASGDQLLLLNNDTIVSPNWLSNMLRCLFSSEDIGIVGPLTNYASGKQQIDLPYTNIMEMAQQLNNPDEAKWQQVDRIVGLCFLLKRQLMEQIGVLDERFSPGHFEDDDYCYRARLARFRLMIAGDVFIYHHGSASFGQQESLNQLIAINRQKFIDKWNVEPGLFI